MKAILLEVDAAQAALEAAFADNSKVIIARGLIMPASDVEMAVFIGVSLRTIEPAEEAEGESLKEAGISVLLQAQENDYDERVLYSDFLLPAVAVLEGAEWGFMGSILDVKKEGALVNLGIRADFMKVIA